MGGRVPGLSTRHRGEIQGCWKVPVHGQKPVLVLHDPRLCRADQSHVQSPMRVPMFVPPQLTTVLTTAGGPSPRPSGDVLLASIQPWAQHPSNLSPPWPRQPCHSPPELEGHRATWEQGDGTGWEQAGGGNLMTCTCLPHPGIRLE